MKKYTAFGIALLFLTACEATPEPPNNHVKKAAQQSQQLAGKQDIQRNIVMYKSPTCDCCGAWADHLRQSGFVVVEKKSDDMDGIKSQFGVPEKLSSCHTAIIDGYVIEGHVPANDVERLLKERPDIIGLTAPGMPMKSPGMQAVGQKPRSYDVLAFSKDGTSKVFSHY